MKNDRYLKGRGAQLNPTSRFESLVREVDPLELLDAEERRPKTQFTEVYPKTILNKVNSPDIGMAWSMNPYQGCEHGCIYCYARPTHNYWGYSAGLDFEQKILVKKNAPELLEVALRKKNWEPMAIMLSGNTDCYQPIEAELKITRSILEVLWRYRHPVGVITKNSLITRDLDLLRQLAAARLVKVSISVTTLEESLRRALEPRTASVAARLKTIKTLADNGIPVNVMMAPIIPGLNDHEILELAKTVADLGASSIYYTMVRLNGDVAEIFEDWIRKNLPDRADRVLNRIRDCHGGNLSDHRFGVRMRGEGQIADMVSQQMQLARKLYFGDRKMPDYDLEGYHRMKNPQLKLF